jgi:NDP-sugar pyrophosphorylase family protein
MFSPASLFSLDEFEHRALFSSLSFPWPALKLLEEYLRDLPLGVEEACAGVYLEHSELILIGEGTEIEPGAYIRGPAVIGRNCRIRHGAYIRGNLAMT